MYNSYLEYVLDNPVNDNDFTKTAGILDAVKGLAGKLAKKPAAEVAEKVIPGREFITKNPEKARVLAEKIQRRNWNQRHNAVEIGRLERDGAKKFIKRFYPNGIADVKPTSVTRNADGTRTLKYENPYPNSSRNDPDFREYTKDIQGQAYDRLLREKARELASTPAKNLRKVHNTTFGLLSPDTNSFGFGVRVGKPSERILAGVSKPSQDFRNMVDRRQMGYI